MRNYIEIFICEYGVFEPGGQLESDIFFSPDDDPFNDTIIARQGSMNARFAFLNLPITFSAPTFTKQYLTLDKIHAVNALNMHAAGIDADPDNSMNLGEVVSFLKVEPGTDIQADAVQKAWKELYTDASPRDTWSHGS